MTSPGRISVVIPCFNAASFLAEALESALGQSRAVDEVIVVDDGSTDGSVAVARRSAVTVLETGGNSGPSRARNLGLDAARTEYVAFLDADDVWLPDHTATVAALLDEHAAAPLAFGRAEMFGRESWVWPALLPPGQLVDALDACAWRCIALPSATIVRRRLVRDAGGFDERLRVAEDYDLWLRLALRAPFVCTHTVTCRRRMHEAQSSHATVHRYWTGEYESRHRLLQERRAELSAGERTRLEALVRDAWTQHLMGAWHDRSADDFDYHLGMRHLVPGAAAVPQAYRWRRRLLPVARLRDRVRSAAALVRRHARTGGTSATI